MSNGKVHYAKTEESDRVYQVFYENELILESNEVVKLEEHYDGKDFPPVIYFPLSALSDLEMSRTELTTTCPIKGSASYWSYKEAENGIWSYENPIQDMNRSQCHSSLKFGSAPVVDYADFFSFFSSALSAPRSNGSCA